MRMVAKVMVARVRWRYLISIFVLPRQQLSTSVEVQLEAVKLTD